MANFFEKRDSWGHGLSLWVLAAMLFVAPAAWWCVQKVDVQSDVGHALVATERAAQLLAWDRALFPDRAELLVSWDGSSLDDPRVEQFADNLMGITDADGIRRHGVTLVDTAITPRALIERMMENGVERDHAIARLEGVLIGPGQLAVALTDLGRQQRDQSLTLIRETAKAEFGIDVEIVDSARKSEGLALANESSAHGAEAAGAPQHAATGALLAPPECDLTIVWRNMHADELRIDQFRERLTALTLPGAADENESVAAQPIIERASLAPGTPVAVAVSLSESGSADREAALEAIRDAAVGAGVERGSIRITGSAAVAAAVDQAVAHVAWNAAYSTAEWYKRSPLVLAWIAAMLSAWLLLRGGRLTAIVVIAAGYTTLIAIAAIPLLGDHLSPTLIVLPPFVFALTIAAAIHIVNYWKHASRRDPRVAVAESAKAAWQPSALAGIAALVGLLALYASPLAPVREFGLYAAIACAVGGIIILYGVPSLLQFAAIPPARNDEFDGGGWSRLARLFVSYRVSIVAISLLAFELCVGGMRHAGVESDIVQGLPAGSHVAQDREFLTQNLSSLSQVDMIVRFDDQAQRELAYPGRLALVRKIESRVRRHAGISGVLSLADFHPHPDRLAIDAGALDDQPLIPLRAVATSDAPFHHSGDEMWRVAAYANPLDAKGQQSLIAELDEIGRTVLRYQAGATHVIAGQLPVTVRTQAALAQSLWLCALWGIGGLAVVTLMAVRSPFGAIVALLPAVLPTGVMLGISLQGGRAIDVGTLLAASAALSIGSLGTVHAITWFRDAASRGLSRSDAIASALKKCGGALCQSHLIAAVGLFALAASDLAPVSHFGMTAGLLIGGCLAGNIVLLPALLAGPLGSIIERSEQTRKPTAVRYPAETPSPHVPLVPRPVGRQVHAD